MNFNILPACLLATALLFPAVGYSDNTKSDNKAITFVKDSAITTKVKAKLAADKATSATSIKVDTDQDGVVWLSGTAKSQAEADKAESIAKATEGVKSVRNDIKVEAK